MVNVKVQVIVSCENKKCDTKETVLARLIKNRNEGGTWIIDCLRPPPKWDYHTWGRLVCPKCLEEAAKGKEI